MAINPRSWRIVDIVTAAVLGVTAGVVFFIWNQIGFAAFTALDVFTPGLGGLVNGIWYMGGPLGLLIIRKPGAGIFVEVTASVVSMAIGSQWGLQALGFGLAQGFGAELVFMATGYKRFGPTIAALSGAGAAAAGMITELFIGATPNIARSLIFNIIYASSSILSGIVLGGLLAWFLTRELARTGVLDRFEAGREFRKRV